MAKRGARCTAGQGLQLGPFNQAQGERNGMGGTLLFVANPVSPSTSNLRDLLLLFFEPRLCTCVFACLRFDAVYFCTPALNSVHAPKAETSNNDFFTAS